MEEGGGDSYTIKVTYFDINLISEVVVGGRVPLLVKAGVDSDREKRPMNCRFQFVHIFPIGAFLNLKLECQKNVEYLKTLNFIVFCLFCANNFVFKSISVHVLFRGFSSRIFFFLKLFYPFLILLLEVKSVSPLNCLFLRIRLFNSV